MRRPRNQNIFPIINKNDVMRLGERPRSLEGKPNITGTDRLIRRQEKRANLLATGESDAGASMGGTDLKHQLARGW